MENVVERNSELSSSDLKKRKIILLCPISKIVLAMCSKAISMAKIPYAFLFSADIKNRRNGMNQLIPFEIISVPPKANADLNCLILFI